LDFFRCEAGLREVPCIFDDGDLFDQKPKVLKAFFDPTQAESMTRERWGGCKFVRGQGRFAADNQYDDKAEPDDVAWQAADAADDTMRKDRRLGFFLDMLEPTFPKGIAMANVRAMLKRCTIILNTKDYLYIRLAGLNSDVTKEPLHGYYIAKDAGVVLFDWITNNKTRDEAEMDDLLQKEAEVVDQAMSKKVQHAREETPAAPTTPPRRNSPGSPLQTAGAASSSSGTAVVIKRERPSWNLAVSSGTIDLCSPSPQKSARKAARVLDDSDVDPMEGPYE
jgi:hypothetical protein